MKRFLKSTALAGALALAIGPPPALAQLGNLGGTTANSSQTGNQIVSCSLAALNAVCQVNSQGSGTVTAVLTGTWAATVTWQGSADNGVTWVSLTATLAGSSGSPSSTATANGTYVITNTAGYALVRADATAYTSGTIGVTLDAASGGTSSSVPTGLPGTPTTAVVSVQGVPGGTSVPVTVPLNPSVELTDGTNGPAAVKAPSTAPAVGDRALVVAISPNSPAQAAAVAQYNTTLPTLANGATAPVSVDVNGRQILAPNTAATAQFHKVTDGTNTAAVKPASTAPLATDPALVVTMSPNSAAAASAPGVYNTSLPTLANAQVASLELDSSGRLLLAPTNTIGAIESGTWANQITDGTHVAAVKAASTNGVQTDTSLSVDLRPKTPSAAGVSLGCTVGASSAQCFTGQTVNFIQLENVSTSATIACAWGATAVLNSPTSFLLQPGQAASWGQSTNGVPSQALNCIASAASTPLYVETH